MIQTVDIFKQIAANLTANVVIDNAVDNLDGTFTLETTNTQWISELEIYSIGGFDYKIESLIQNVSLTISPVSNGALPTATGFVIPAPTFINGTLKMAKNEVDAIKNKMDLVPFIYLYEVIRDRKNTDDESTVERECDLRFFFINSSSFQNMLTEDVYERVIYPLHPLVELFITKIKASPLFTDVLNYDEINLINFSEEGNQINSVFDLNLSAIELRLQAEIRSVNCDDIFVNPNPTCLPVRITDENVVVEVAAGMAYTCSNSEPCEDAVLEINGTETISIPSGDTFDLTVTLDGLEAGTYNEATDTWEVESDPCPPTEITFTFDNNLIDVVDTSPYNIDCSTTLDVAIITDNITFNGTYVADGTQNGQTKYVNTLNSNLVIIGGAAWQVKDLFGIIITQDPPTGQDYPWEADWGGQLTMTQATIEDYCLEPCADATYTIKDSANTTLYSGSIASGGDLQQTVSDSTVNVRKSDNTLISAVTVEAEGSDDYLVADSTVNVRKSDNTLITAVTVKATDTVSQQVSDSEVTVNGNAYADVKATDSLDVAVEYSDATNVGTIVGGIVEIPDNRFNTASIIKTGQTTSYSANDDGALQRGSGVDFLTLSYNNPFGNTNRFTDSVGGQTYANGEAYDWANADYVNRLVPVWYLTPQTAATWANAMTNQPYTVNSQNWYIPNVQEAYTLMNMGVAGSRLNFAPFNLTSSASGQGFWTSTTNRDSTTIAIRIAVDAGLGTGTTGLGISNIVKTNQCNFLLIRYASF